MPSASDVPNMPKVKGSRAAMKKRQELRLAGKLNPPIRSWPRGLGAAVASMQGRHVHSLFCRCKGCLPTEMHSNPSLPITYE